MKKPVLFALIAVIVLLAGAAGVLVQRYRSTSSDLASVRTSEQDLRDRYGAAITEIATIQDSLDAIALGDSTVRLLPSAFEAERRVADLQGDEALARIALIRAGIERTKVRIHDLEAGLEKSGVRIAGLQRMIAGLRRDVTEKEALVTRLSSRVDSLETTVTGLTADVARSRDTIGQQARAIESARRELGTIHVIIGSKRDLVGAGVIVATGGFLGLGRTLEPSGHYEPRHFTAVDTDVQTEIRIPAGRARVLSAQPVSSYELGLHDGQMMLRILDPAEFRKVKHVVILTT